MATYRVVLEFIESNGAQFNEVYFKSATTIDEALNTSPGFNDARWALLHPLNTHLRWRVSDVNSPRKTGVRNANIAGTAVGLKGPLPAGASVVLGLGAVGGGQRKLWLRGCPADFYTRNSTSGKDEPSAQLLNVLKSYFAGLKNSGYGIRRLKPKEDNGFLQNKKILSVDGTRKDGTSDVKLEAAPGYPVPGRVVIGGASKKDLPNINGHWSIIKVLGDLVTIPYQTPSGLLVTGGNGYMRQEQYFDVGVFDPSSCAIDHLGTRTTKNPLSRSRGARRAQRLRTSL